MLRLCALLILCSLAHAADRVTDTTATLPVITLEERARLAHNPDGASPADLNRDVPALHLVEVDNTISDAAPVSELHCVAWNMERGRHWEDAVMLVRDHPALREADLFFLSEMDFGMARSGNDHTTREFAHALNMNYAYGVEFLELSKGKPGEIRGGENDRGYHGNAIISRFPLHNVRMLRFPGIEKWYGSDEHRLGGRNAILAEIDVNGARVTLVSTHLESGLQDNEIRAREGRIILDELNAHAANQPVILGGDLNAFHKAAVIPDLRDAGFLVDEANVLDQGTTQYTRDGEIRLGGAHIDYLAVRGGTVNTHEWSPAVVPAVWPVGEGGRSLGDHAIVTATFHVPATDSQPEP
jgi:endonuclease/exonuclease/phosphatase family metal-dependent hydrolase